MAAVSNPEDTKKNGEEPNSVQSPDADYGLKNGFDPAKYEFYNPTSHKAQKASAKCQEENHTGDPGTPEPLSPIEELEDEPLSLQPKQNIDSAHLRSLQDGSREPPVTVDSGHASVEETSGGPLTLERRTDLLFSRQHLRAIFANQTLSRRFATFLQTYRPNSVQILTYYLDAVKALKTIKYAESIIRGLEPVSGHAFTKDASSATMAWVMEDKADRALDVLVQNDMPAFIASIYAKMVDRALLDRMIGKQEPSSRAIAEGLAEVFILSDPAKPDNPIVFSSEEFHRTTGFTRKEFLGRNCRLLGGKKTNPSGIGRFRLSVDAERQHCEVLLNYRRDGSPFVNLIMCVPLRDQVNKVRYFLGAQLDITELVDDCTGMNSFRKVIEGEDKRLNRTSCGETINDEFSGDEFVEMSQAFSPQEFEKLLLLERHQQAEFQVIRPAGAREHRKMIETPATEIDEKKVAGERIAPPLGFYHSYLLVRPHPALRIIFASSDLRSPEILQQPLMKSIGGSSRVRQDLAHALEVGRKVTAKVHWISTSTPKPKNTWLHCTPLLGADESIGVWMVILVDADASDEIRTDRKGLEPKARTENRLKEQSTADVIPWETGLEKSRTGGLSTTPLNEGDQEISDDEIIYSRPKRAEKGLPPSISRAGPSSRIKAGVAADAEHLVLAANNTPTIVDIRPSSRNERPPSQGSSVLPMRTHLRPTVKIAGRPSFDGVGTKAPPIHTPGQQDLQAADDHPDGLRPARKRTYKSLSPYGIIFDG